MSYLRLPVLASSGVAVLASGILYFKQNEVIYPRSLPPGSRTEVPAPSQFGITNAEDLHIPTSDNESLHAYLLRPANHSIAQPITILMFHGNAGNIGHRLPIGKIFSDSLGCNVLMLEYRGYGLSTGTPDEKGLVIDAQTALDYIRDRKELRDTKIVIYGQSLGGAVAVDLVSRNRGAEKVLAGLILDNTFLSIKKMIPAAFPPARYLARLCHQYWPSEESIPKITDVPILFISGLKDEIVPPSHMRQLYDLSRAKKKIWRALPNGTHDGSVAEEGYFDYVFEFLMGDVMGYKLSQDSDEDNH